MLFGSRSKIAIECSIEAENARWRFGRVCLWAKGVAIGDFEQIMVIAVTTGFFSGFLERSGERYDPQLNSLSALDLVSTLCDALFGDGQQDLKETAQQGQRFGKYCVCPGGGEAFDGWLAFLLEDQNKTRFIWQDTSTGQIDEIDLVSGEFEDIVRHFIVWASDECK
jgi:hypothetical protein